MEELFKAMQEALDILLDAKGSYLMKKLLVEKTKPTFKNNIIKFKDLQQNNTFNSKTRDLVEKKESEEEEMKGSVRYRPKEKRWEGRFYFLSKRYYVYAKTETECWQKLRAKRKELKEEKREDTTISKNMTLNTWFDFWSENFKKQEVRESTFSKLNENYDRYIREVIGKKRITNIDYIDIQKLINSLTAYTPKEKCVRILKEVFGLLVKEKYISKNPMNLVVMPKRNTESKVLLKKTDAGVITSIEERKIFDSFSEKNNVYYAVKFILYTGLRRGEALGLIWSNVDLDNNRIYIDRQYNVVVKKITEPKTINATRYVPLLPEAREVLMELIKQPHYDTDEVFQDINRLTQRISYLSKKLETPFTAHILRHTYASRLYASGVDSKAIQMLLGHESVDTTLNTYVHLIQNVDKELLKRIREFFINQNIIKLLDWPPIWPPTFY